MKKAIIILCMLIGLPLVVHAQDIIIRKDGTEVKAKVLEVNPGEIKYKRFDNQDGPVYNEEKNWILKIKYANGSEDIFVREYAPAVTTEQIVWQAVPREKKTPRVRYSGLVEASVYLGDCSVESGYYGLSLTTTHGIQIVDKYFVGLGVGVNFNSLSDTYVPVYATFRLDLSRAATRPFISGSIGAQFANFGYQEYYYNQGVSYMDVGLWTNVMFGYRFKNKLYVAGGITIQSANRLTYIDVYDENGHYDYDDTYSEDIYGSVSLMLSFGYRF